MKIYLKTANMLTPYDFFEEILKYDDQGKPFIDVKFNRFIFFEENGDPYMKCYILRRSDKKKLN